MLVNESEWTLSTEEDYEKSFKLASILIKIF